MSCAIWALTPGLSLPSAAEVRGEEEKRGEWEGSVIKIGYWNSFVLCRRGEREGGAVRTNLKAEKGAVLPWRRRGMMIMCCS